MAPGLFTASSCSAERGYVRDVNARARARTTISGFPRSGCKTRGISYAVRHKKCKVLIVPHSSILRPLQTTSSDEAIHSYCGPAASGIKLRNCRQAKGKAAAGPEKGAAEGPVMEYKIEPVVRFHSEPYEN